MPAEWEPVAAVLMAWPHEDTDWAPMLDDIHRCYTDIITALTTIARVPVILIAPCPADTRKAFAGIPADMLVIVGADTNDTWTRDYGPITVTTLDGSPRLLDFTFNAWGLKFAADADNRANRALAHIKVFTAPLESHLDFVLEGGSIESDGRGTILTTSRCLLAPNRNDTLSRDDITRRLCSSLGASRVLWLDHGSLIGDDTDSHVDTLARLAPADTIIYTGCDDPADPHYSDLGEMARQLATFTTVDGQPYNLIALPLPDPVIDPDNGDRLPATYANYLVVNNNILLPVYNQPRKDALAAGMMRIAFPDARIIPVDCRPLVRQHGSLHCATMQLYPATTIL